MGSDPDPAGARFRRSRSRDSGGRRSSASSNATKRSPSRAFASRDVAPLDRNREGAGGGGAGQCGTRKHRQGRRLRCAQRGDRHSRRRHRGQRGDRRHTPQGKRQAIIDAFQNTDHPRVLILQIQVAGTAMTLHAASRVVFAETSWAPGERTGGEALPPHRPEALGAGERGLTRWQHRPAGIRCLTRKARELAKLEFFNRNSSMKYRSILTSKQTRKRRRYGSRAPGRVPTGQWRYGARTGEAAGARTCTEDERRDGTRTAKAGRGGKRAKPHGGARPGAGRPRKTWPLWRQRRACCNSRARAAGPAGCDRDREAVRPRRIHKGHQEVG